MPKKRFAIAGTGMRGRCYAMALLSGEYADCAELVALFDNNPLRMNGFKELIGCNAPGFTEFDKMVAATHPTHLIICTPDATHHEMIEQAFRNGLDVITEKPLTTDAEKTRKILDLERQYKRQVIVTFNCRYMPYLAKIKELIRAGRLGKILSATLEWHLDCFHGASYFRRWNAHMAISGGLLVHKATHHFDIVNWLIADEPAEVSAFGALKVYGRNGPYRGERCSTCPHNEECPYSFTVIRRKFAGPEDELLMRKLWWEAESVDGYFPEKCVFDPAIDIYDTMNAIVRYKGGAQLSYALNAYSPAEGYTLFLTGTEARLEAREGHAGMELHATEKQSVIRIIHGESRRNVKTDEIVVGAETGEAHGGGDKRLYRNLFRGDLPDPLNQMAGSRDGAMSCLIGIAANRSILEKRGILIEALLK